MKKRFFIYSLITIFLLSFLVLTPLVSAKTRNNYLIEYTDSCKIEDLGFANTNMGSEISFEATFYALEIYEYFGLINQKINSEFNDNLVNFINELFSNNEVNLNDLYYLTASLDIAGYSLQNSDFKEKIDLYLNQSEKAEGGFSTVNISSNPSLVSTFQAFKIRQLIGEDTSNSNLHISWILKHNSSNGGFGNEEGSNPTLLNTHYAIASLEILDSVDQIPNRTLTLQYLNSFYHLSGGYLPFLNNNVPLMSSTYFVCNSISNLGNNGFISRSKTIEWILDRQNPMNGGFTDLSNSQQEESSSVTISRFALKTLTILNGQEFLNQEIGPIEFNWLILLIVLVSIAVLIALGYFLWKRKQL